jgi:expansin (peptidoglycan-binding protein)
MKIVVNGKYTFESGKFSPKVGEKVTLPTPSWRAAIDGSTWEGTVTALGSNYTGYIRTILGVVAPVPAPATITILNPANVTVSSEYVTVKELEKRLRQAVSVRIGNKEYRYDFSANRWYEVDAN